mgnify:CR=1
MNDPSYSTSATTAGAAATTVAAAVVLVTVAVKLKNHDDKIILFSMTTILNYNETHHTQFVFT